MKRLTFNLLFFPLFFAGCLQGSANQTDLLGALTLSVERILPSDLTIENVSATYVSSSIGANTSTMISWTSEVAGAYKVLLGGTDCEDGTELEAGTAAANVTLSTAAIPATTFQIGTNTLRFCIASAEESLSRTILIIRDDDPPTVNVSPSAGSFGSIVPSIEAECVDTGASGCLTVAYTTGGTTDPVVDIDGVVTVGNTYHDPLTPTNPGITEIRFVAKDNAGNTSAIVTGGYTVDTETPSITLHNVATNLLAATGTSEIEWEADRSGDCVIKKGNCTTGTTLGTVSVGAAAPTTWNINSTSLSDGANTITICMTNLVGTVGSSSFSITKDATAPTLSSANPFSGALSTSTQNLVFTYVFSENMRTATAPMPTIEIRTGSSSYVALSLPNTQAAWINANTLEFRINSQLPELTDIRWRFSETVLQDVAGNSVAGDMNDEIKGTLQTGLSPFSISNLTDDDQTVCSDSDGTPISCISTGQDAAFLNSPFSKSFAGPGVYMPAYPNDIVTTDNRTGLIWKTCSQGQAWTGSTCDPDWSGALRLSWQAAISNCLALNNANSGLGYAGLRTWHLPTLSEFFTIMVYVSSKVTISPSAFPNTVADSGEGTYSYWTGTAALGSGFQNAYKFRTYAGQISPDDKTDSYYTRCVATP